MKIAVLMTSYNRVEITLAALRSLVAAAGNFENHSIEVFSVDDASPDNTGKIVAASFPEVHVIQGTGNLFWNRGIALAYAHAKAVGGFDAYLLLNDDVVLFPDALRRMVEAFLKLNSSSPAIAIGGTLSRVTGKTTYGGFDIGSKFRVSDFKRIAPDGTLRRCDTFNAALVLVPAAPMDKVGGIDPVYHHAYGDIDLGLVLQRQGVHSFLLPEHTGYCEDNPPPAPQPISERIRALFKPMAPVSDQIHFAYRRFPWYIATVVAALQLGKRLLEVVLPRRS